jgi:GNAT superfamily N-acetyltransferase
MFEPRYIGKRPSVVNPRGHVDNIERIIIGEEIPQRCRLTWPGDNSIAQWISGDVGFLDFEECKDGKITFAYLRLIGIEPAYRRQGHATRLLREFERIITSRHIPRILTSGIKIKNKAMLLLMETLQYQEFFIDKCPVPWRKYKKSHPLHIKDVFFEKYVL